MCRERRSRGLINEKGKPGKTEVTIEIPENNLVTNTDELALDTVCHRPNLSFGKREWKASLEVQTSEETSIPKII